MSRVPHNLKIFCKGSATAKSLRITDIEGEKLKTLG